MEKNELFKPYTCVEVRTVSPAAQEHHDILSALLADAGFESFESEDDLLKAYIPSSLYDAGALSLMEGMDFVTGISVREIPGENWNKVWEESFQPVEIAGHFYIRADFHPPKPGLTEIIINPEMSFGTGHHATTAMCLELLAGLDVQGQVVIDMGCGTGILGIAASLQGAASVICVDNDPVCIENTKANCLKNQRKNVKIVDWQPALQLEKAGLILANIQRNVLLEQMPWYAAHLLGNGWLIVSGFNPGNEKDIVISAQTFGLQHIATAKNRDWAAALLQKAGRA